MRQRLILILTVIFFCGLIGCGNTGDLYLPESTTANQEKEY